MPPLAPSPPASPHPFSARPSRHRHGAIPFICVLLLALLLKQAPAKPQPIDLRSVCTHSPWTAGLQWVHHKWPRSCLYTKQPTYLRRRPPHDVRNHRRSTPFGRTIRPETTHAPVLVRPVVSFH